MTSRELAERFASHILRFPNELREWREVKWEVPQHETVVAWFEKYIDLYVKVKEVRVLERAAKVCEGYRDDEPPEPGEGPDTWDWHAKNYARAVRSLAATLPRLEKSR